MGRASYPIAAIALLAALLALAPSAAAKRPLFGFNDAADSFERHPHRAAAGGARIARVPVSWELTEPEPGEYDWSAIDPAAAALRARGIRILFALSAAPDWARTGCEPNFPLTTCGPGRGHEDDYQRLALALLARYPGSKIQAWNEPNIELFGALHPKRVAALTNALYAVAPRAIVGPAASPGDARHLPYTRRMYRHINRHVPLGVNFYPRSVVSLRGLVEDWPTVREIARKRQIWVTEIGFASSEYGRAGQARRAAHAYRFLARRGAHAIIFHRLLDVHIEGSRWLSSLGMLDAHGNPKPAFAALRRAIRRAH